MMKTTFDFNEIVYFVRLSQFDFDLAHDWAELKATRYFYSYIYESLDKLEPWQKMYLKQIDRKGM